MSSVTELTEHLLSDSVSQTSVAKFFWTRNVVFQEDQKTQKIKFPLTLKLGDCEKLVKSKN